MCLLSARVRIYVARIRGIWRGRRAGGSARDTIAGDGKRESGKLWAEGDKRVCSFRLSVCLLGVCMGGWCATAAPKQSVTATSSSFFFGGGQERKALDFAPAYLHIHTCCQSRALPSLLPGLVILRDGLTGRTRFSYPFHPHTPDSGQSERVLYVSMICAPALRYPDTAVRSTHSSKTCVYSVLQLGVDRKEGSCCEEPRSSRP